MAWELFVSLRYLRSRRNEVFVSVITVIATLGVLLGVMVLTIAMSVMTGFEEDLRSRILGLHPHVRVAKRLGAGVIEQPRELVEALAADPRVLDAAPVVHSQLLIAAGDHMIGVLARGIDPTLQCSVSAIADYVVEGDLAALADRIEHQGAELPTIMIGRELAHDLLVGTGDVVRVMSPRVSPSPLGALPRSRRFVVAAVYDSGMGQYDSALVYLGIDSARALLGTGPIATGIEARLVDPYEAPAVASELGAEIGVAYHVESWTSAHRNVFEALELEKTAYFLILLLIILVAAFTIVSTLYMVVMEKRRDVAVLKAMGATDRSVAMIFVLKGLLIGTVGTGLGALFGYLACLGLDRYELFDLPEGVFYVSTLPVRIVPAEFAIVIVASMIICLGACLFPGWKAARVVPVDVLRYE